MSERSSQAPRRGLQAAYERLKAAYLEQRNFQVPRICRSTFVHWGGGAEVQYIFRQFLRTAPVGGSVLIVGVMGGRDYYLCRNLGYRVTAADLGPQPEIDPIRICDVEQGLPFPEAAFDAVIVSEIIEHLLADDRFVAEIRRVLKPAGKMLVSLPYYNDWEAGHIRIYSPRSARRLFEASGFRIEDYLERPGIGIWPGRLNIVIHGFALISYWLFGRTIYRWATAAAGSLEYRCGHWRRLRWLRSLSRHFGGYYLCVKGEALDHVALNRTVYTQAAEARDGALS